MTDSDTILALIPARGGSKGIPKKNILSLAGRPLIHYTLDAACAVFPRDSICVSTDSEEIVQVVENYGVRVPFRRPPELATDSASNADVVVHALSYYRSAGRRIKTIALLQPTSPLRTGGHIRCALGSYTPEIDMVVSVKIAPANPYHVFFTEDQRGFLQRLLDRHFQRRQDCPQVFQINGAIYIINADSLERKPMDAFTKVVKFVMDERSSVDIDDWHDWEYAEYLLTNRK